MLWCFEQRCCRRNYKNVILTVLFLQAMLFFMAKKPANKPKDKPIYKNAVIDGLNNGELVRFDHDVWPREVVNKVKREGIKTRSKKIRPGNKSPYKAPHENLHGNPPENPQEYQPVLKMGKLNKQQKNLGKDVKLQKDANGYNQDISAEHFHRQKHIQLVSPKKNKEPIQRRLDKGAKNFHKKDIINIGADIEKANKSKRSKRSKTKFLTPKETKIPNVQKDMNLEKALQTNQQNQINNQQNSTLNKTRNPIHFPQRKVVFTDETDFEIIPDKATELAIIRKKLLKVQSLMKQWKKFNPNFTEVPQDNKDYFVETASLICLKEGTDLLILNSNVTFTDCPCKNTWFGEHCSIPEAVHASKAYRKLTRLTLRKSPRRIIQSLPFVSEWDMLDLRFYDTGDIVDAFIILDSIFTAYGDLRDLTLLPALLDGKYPYDVTRKVIPVVLDYYPEEAQENGWIFDALYRNHPFAKGLPKEVSNVDDDDYILINDADEVPNRDVLLFLKLHDGIPQPFSFRFKQTTFGFFWGSGHKILQSGASVKLLREVYNDKPNILRARDPLDGAFQSFADRNPGSEIFQWTIGGRNISAGIHCSWCASPEKIRTKLISGINGDFPRWGDFPEKCDVTYIRDLVSRGSWFSENRCFREVPQEKRNFAPEFFLKHQEEYSHLLVNPYRNGTEACVKNEEAERELKPVRGWHRLSRKQIEDIKEQYDAN